MNEPKIKWSLGPCPVCEGGNCYVRWCTGTTPALPIVLCDECEAFWTSPDISQPHGFIDSESGRVGESDWCAWGNESRWASADEVTLLGWDRPSGPISTDWVFPAVDSSIADAISFFVDTPSITITGSDINVESQILGPSPNDPPPPKNP